MNTVKREFSVLSQQSYLLKEVILDGHKSPETAFIGRCGNGPKNSLYLIAYEGIFLADDPIKYWSGKNVTVDVVAFVDVEITIKER